MNRLAKETSPYLRQHEGNPVDWYPWGDEALRRARDEDRPILLSVGYSACHWCHVMAHECFENVEIARVMNEHFVCIKVDREERPDLDQIYQNVAQALTRGGGWPLTVFLTPDLRPFYGGTYFPPEDRYGRPGFPRLLRSLARAYREERDDVLENAEKLTAIVRKLEGGGALGERMGETESARARADADVAGAGVSSDAENDARIDARIAKAVDEILSFVDWTEGGFGAAPKFPNTMMLSFLWRAATGAVGLADETREAARAAVLLALEKMARGGIFDQLGGGFHRYSVDERWLVPHFEKMLYDNGLLLRIYAEILLDDRRRPVLGDELRALFRATVEKTVAYVGRELVGPDGFIAAQDADSEGEEGKFFVWKSEELRAILSDAEYAAFARHYGVTDEGNFEHGHTILCQAEERPGPRPSAGAPVAREGTSESASEELALLENAEHKAFAVRAGRVRPGDDTKVLVGWNGLMVSGLVWASAALGDRPVGASGRSAAGALEGSGGGAIDNRTGGAADNRAELAADLAKRAYARVRAKAWREAGISTAGAGSTPAPEVRLAATIQAGEPKQNGYLDDYAFLALAAMDLARLASTTRDWGEAEARIDDARALSRTIVARFADRADSGYFFTSDDHEVLLARPKSLYDQAIPSGTAVAAQVFLFLAEKDEAANAEARRLLAGLREATFANAFGHGEMLWVYLLARRGAAVVEGNAAGEFAWYVQALPLGSGEEASGEGASRKGADAGDAGSTNANARIPADTVQICRGFTCRKLSLADARQELVF